MVLSPREKKASQQPLYWWSVSYATCSKNVFGEDGKYFKTGIAKGKFNRTRMKIEKTL